MIASSSKPLLRWPCSSTSLNSSSLKLGRRSHHIARSSQDDIPHNIVVYDLHDTVIPYEEVCKVVAVGSLCSLMTDEHAGMEMAKIAG